MLNHRVSRQSALFMGLIAVLAISAWAPRDASASFHLWTISEVYSSPDGSVQYVELATTSGGQTVMGGKVITASWDGGSTTFTLPEGISYSIDDLGGTANLLVATSNFEDATGVAPDYVLPCEFIDPTVEGEITVCFGSAAACSTDSVSFNGSDLRADDTQSISGAGTAAANSPRNLSGDDGALEADFTAEECVVDEPEPTEDTGSEDVGGEDTGGEDTGGEDTGAEDTGAGEDTGGVDTGGGADTGTDAPTTGGGGSTEEDEGCSTAGRGAEAGAVAMFLALVAVTWRRRRVAR